MTRQKRCQPFAPSIMAASSISAPMFCSAAMNSSMNVPLVVKIAIMMNADIATDGPRSTPTTTRRGTLVREQSRAGRRGRPSPSAMWTMPSRVLEPVRAVDADPRQDLVDDAGGVEKRNSHSTVMATELVTDGKVERRAEESAAAQDRAVHEHRQEERERRLQRHDEERRTRRCCAARCRSSRSVSPPPVVTAA